MRSKIVSLLATAFSLALIPAAYAADMPTKAPAPMMAPMYNWAGWYVGGNIGYGWGVNSNPDLTFADPGGLVGFVPYFATSGNVTPNVRPKGVIGGLQLGYNWQSNNFVYGLVTDIQASGMKASGTNTVAPAALSNSVQTDWFGTFRAKLGFAQNNWLFYATGGLAYGQVKTSGSFIAPNTTVSFAGSNSTTRAGWTAGAGLNYGLTPNWILGAEYLYVDLGRVSHTETQTIFPGAFITIGNRAADHIGRITLDYKF